MKPFEAAGGVAWVEDSNRVNASIQNPTNDPASKVQSKAGSVSVTASVNNRPDVTAGADIGSPSDKAIDKGTDPALFSGSAAFARGIYTNEAKAIIGANAIVDAQSDLTVKSEVLNDFVPAQFSNLFDPLTGFVAPQIDHTSREKSVKIEEGDIVRLMDDFSRN